MILPIYLYGMSVLRKKAEDITPAYPQLDKLIKEMYDTLKSSEGVGLAAPQIGLSIRLLVLDLDPLSDIYPDYKGVLKTMLNVVIQESTGPNVTREEGCLSFPGIHESVTRKEKIMVSYVDENFVHHSEWFEGYIARIIQHECDHLDGKMFIDYASPIRKQLIKSKLNAILKGKISCDYKVKSLK
ncbi:MAG: peptide deformylase, partial [Bacteroidales bacterium]